MYDFFNSSYTAFGRNITKVFQSLARKLDECEKYMSVISTKLSNLNNYLGRNYSVTNPIKDSNPVPGKFIYDVLNMNKLFIKTFDFNNNKIFIEGTIYDNNSYSVHTLTGNSEGINKGICYFNPKSVNEQITLTFEAISSDTDPKILEFDLYKPNNILLFSFEILDDRVILSHVNSLMNMFPDSYTGHYKRVVIYEILSFPFTLRDYEAVICTADRQTDTSLTANDKVVWHFNGTQNHYPTSYGYTGIYYGKPGDEINRTSGSLRVFTIGYISTVGT